MVLPAFYVLIVWYVYLFLCCGIQPDSAARTPVRTRQVAPCRLGTDSDAPAQAILSRWLTQAVSELAAVFLPGSGQGVPCQ